MKKTIIISLLALLSVLYSACYYNYDNSNVQACFYTQKTTYYVGETILFYNCSDFASEYLWNFDDGTTSRYYNPTHEFTEPGIYEVQLTAFNHNYSDNAYLAIEIIEEVGEQTGLNILVLYFGTEDPVSDCYVDLYDNEENYLNFENPIATDQTESDGIVEFADLQPIIYYIDAFRSISDTSYYSNELLGVATDTLEEGEMNYYDVYVQYIINSGKFKIMEIEKSTAQLREKFYQ